MAFRWRADDGPLIMVVGSFLPHQIKKKYRSWTPLTKVSGSAHAFVVFVGFCWFLLCVFLFVCFLFCHYLLPSIQYAISEGSVETARMLKLVSAFTDDLCYKHLMSCAGSVIYVHCKKGMTVQHIRWRVGGNRKR